MHFNDFSPLSLDFPFSSHAMGLNQLCTFSGEACEKSRALPMSRPNHVCCGITRVRDCGRGVAGWLCKGSHGKDPLSARNASQVREREQGCWGNTLGMGQVPLWALSAIKAEAELKRLVESSKPPPQPPCIHPYPLASSWLVWVQDQQPFDSPILFLLCTIIYYS